MGTQVIPYSHRPEAACAASGHSERSFLAWNGHYDVRQHPWVSVTPLCLTVAVAYPDIRSNHTDSHCDPEAVALTYAPTPTSKNGTGLSPGFLVLQYRAVSSRNLN